MGLDQYAYIAARAGQKNEWWENSTFDEDAKEYVNRAAVKPIEIAYWRKHPNLQGWMEKLWIEKGYPGLPPGQTKFDYAFNNVELELTWDDVDRLEKDIVSGVVARMDTTGFFFGNPSDDDYYEHDLKFCKDAKAHLFLGLKVFYDSSW